MTVAARPAFRSLAQALVGSPLPTDPVRAGSFASNMGLPPACRKDAKIRPMRPQRSRFPARRSAPRLINLDRFDKNFCGACLERIDQEPSVHAATTGRGRQLRSSTGPICTGVDCVTRHRYRAVERLEPYGNGWLAGITRCVKARRAAAFDARKQKARLVSRAFSSRTSRKF